MKIGKLNSRIQRLGSKTRQDISRVVGKTNKVIGSIEKGAKSAVGEVSKVADSAVVRGIQQGTGIAGRALVASGTPQGAALGGALMGVHQGIKSARAAIPDKVEKVQKRIGGASNKLQEQVTNAGIKSTAGVRKATETTGNALEKAPPKESGWDALPQYVD